MNLTTHNIKTPGNSTAKRKTGDKLLNALSAISVIIIASLFQSCFTGVEGTKKITLSKKELSSVAPTEEEAFLQNIDIPAAGQWKKGRKFIVTDSKINILMEKQGSEMLQTGDTIRYDHIIEKASPGGTMRSMIYFTLNGKTFGMPVEKSLEDTKNDVSGANLPMLIDLDLVEELDAKLRGKKLWTRTTLWYDENLNYKDGKKFIPVEISGIKAGDMYFPARVNFIDEKGESSTVLMSVGKSGTETRGFAKLFILHDPRKDYKNITDENWAAIQRGELRLGMTKEECKLSIGNPSETNVGHDYSRTLEIWNYKDGTFVQFADDVIVNFRK